MIARLRLVYPSWHLAPPSWAHWFRQVAFARPRRVDDVSGTERAAMQAARERRASEIRVDAERCWFGVHPRCPSEHHSLRR